MNQDLRSNDLLIGVDIGGTKVAVGLVDASGKISSPARVPMISNLSAEEGLNAVLAAIDQVMPKGTTAIAGIGVCSPGPLDPYAGVILNPPNLPCWRNFPLAESVRKLHSVPVKVDNDANAAALAETRWGAARGYKNVFYATLGTGIGTGIVFDGDIYHGRTGAAGEGGHMSIDYRGPICGCGKPGCIEVLASGPAMARRAREKLAAGAKSSLPDLAGRDLAAINGELIVRAAAGGDQVSRDLLTETAEMIAVWLGNIVDLLDPEIIVIGGGAGAALDFELVKSRVPRLAINPRAHEVPIVRARYGADSGIAGGAALCA